LDLLTPTTVATFEILAVRSIPGGFDVEFTQPAGAAAGVAANYQVKTTVFTPVQAYGQDSSSADNNISVGVTSASLSADGLHATLKLASLATLRMYAITMSKVTSATGQQPYNNVAYYTLNKVATVSAVKPGSAIAKSLRPMVREGSVSIEIPFNRPYDLGLFGLEGRKLAGLKGNSPATLVSGKLKPGIYILAGNVDGSVLHEKVRVE